VAGLVRKGGRFGAKPVADFTGIRTPEWNPEMSAISELEKLTKQDASDAGMQAQVENYQVVFIGGEFSDDENFIGVAVSVEPKSIWPLETVVESTHQQIQQLDDSYREISRIKTTINGNEAIIQSYTGEDSEDFPTGFYAAYVAADKFVWTVGCLCAAGELDSNLETFDQVVRSLRVEY
jgi:hypothetical protein